MLETVKAGERRAGERAFGLKIGINGLLLCLHEIPHFVSRIALGFSPEMGIFLQGYENKQNINFARAVTGKWQSYGWPQEGMKNSLSRGFRVASFWLGMDILGRGIVFCKCLICMGVSAAFSPRTGRWH
jgi:hypothetical protein